MEFFLDTGLINEIKEAVELGIINGVTTNPSLIAQTKRPLKEVITEIAGIVDGPISAEVNATDYEGMMSEGLELSKIHKNIVIKLPLTEAGIKACAEFSKKGIKTNVTLCFSVNQALLAAKAGATYVSPFIGRLDDIGDNGINLIKDIKKLFTEYQFKTKILAASIRHSAHLRECALLGVDTATMPLKVVKNLYHHPLTDKGLAAFLSDYEKSKSLK